MTSVAATQYLPVAGTASLTSDSLVVSLHDVAPSTWEISQKILSELARCGIRATSILVVPDYHHQGAITDRTFSFVAAGARIGRPRIVIHGYFHERPPHPGESLFKRFLVTQVYTQGEGEFFDLGYDEALRADHRCPGCLPNSRPQPHGFIAPAWLLGREGEERGSRCRNGIHHSPQFDSRSSLREKISRAPSLVYSVGSQWRRQTSLCWNATLAQLARSEPGLALERSPGGLFPFCHLETNLSADRKYGLDSELTRPIGIGRPNGD